VSRLKTLNSILLFLCFTQAVAVTFVRFFLEPAGHIGEALNRLVTAAFNDLPFYLWLPVFLLIVLLIVLTMFFASGYRVRGWLWNIEPHRPIEPLRDRIKHLEAERQAWLDETQDLRRQLVVERHDRTEERARFEELKVSFPYPVSQQRVRLGWMILKPWASYLHLCACHQAVNVVQV